jgi:SAM-dependent methyltransferase
MRPVRAIRLIGVGPALLGGLTHRDSTSPPFGVDRLLVGANQRIFERGWVPPWVWSDQRCRRYWATRTSTEAGNRPSDNASKPTAVVDAMVEFWSPDVSSSASVLEIGCNTGPNLERLRQLDYSKLSGVEINRASLEEMRSRFPTLARQVQIHHGSAEDALPRLADSSVDVVFSMAVLHHIHPASNSVFADMVRVARDYVFVLEPETITNSYVFARDYGRVFERLGCTMIRKREFQAENLAAVDEAYLGYVARLFRVPGSQCGHAASTA